MSQTYNLATVRQMLDELFDIKELRTIAFDLFPKIQKEHPENTPMSVFLRELISHAENQMQVEKLILRVKSERTEQFPSYQPKLINYEISESDSDEIKELIKTIGRQQSQLVSLEQTASLEEDEVEREDYLEKAERLKARIAANQTKVAELREAWRQAIELAKQNLGEPIKAAKNQTLLIANAPYALDSGLVGRKKELLLINDWFHNDSDNLLLAVIGLGGQGKSALIWTWLKQQMKMGETPSLIVWWGFYESDGTIAHLVEKVLTYFNDDYSKYKSLRAATDRLLEYMGQTESIFILDGVERLLRAYGSMGAVYQEDGLKAGLQFNQARQCINPIAGNLLKWLASGLKQTKTIISSRLFPSDLSGQTGIMLTGIKRLDLTGLSPNSTLELFNQANVRTTLSEVVKTCEPLGYHPLSLRILASNVTEDILNPQNDLHKAIDFDSNTSLLSKRQHILARAYDTLPIAAQNVLSKLAAFRSSITTDILSEILKGEENLQRNLTLLQKRGLIQISTPQSFTEPGTQKSNIIFQKNIVTAINLHPIVRRYAYFRLNNPAEVHDQIIEYFQASPQPNKIKSLTALQPTIELYYNLIKAYRYESAWDLLHNRLWKSMYYQLGAYYLLIELLEELFEGNIDKTFLFSNKSTEILALALLGNCYSLSGKPLLAKPILEQVLHLSKRTKNKRDLAKSLSNFTSMIQLRIGTLASADKSLKQSIRLSKKNGDKFSLAIARQHYGRLLALTGKWEDAEEEFSKSIAFHIKRKKIQNQGRIWIYRAELALLQGNGKYGILAAQKALDNINKMSELSRPNKRDFIRAYWLRGWAYTIMGDFKKAQTDLDTALNRNRSVNMVDHEPSILIAQSRLSFALAKQVKVNNEIEQHIKLKSQTVFQQAIELANEAITIAERAGYALNLADLHNLLAQIALERGDRPKAREHAQQARDYAWCDGPPYAYQVALDEAERLLGLVS